MLNYKHNSIKITKVTNFFVLLLLISITYSCSNSYNPNINRGSNYLFQVGHPQATISAIGLFNQQGKPGIEVTTDIVYGSLIYKHKDGFYTANINIQIEIAKQKSDSTLGVSRNYNLSIRKKNKDIIHSGELMTFQKRFPVQPGNYKISVVVTDKDSKKQTVRVAHAAIPSPNTNQVNVTDVLLLAKNTSSKQKKVYLPVTTYDVPGKMDSLKFEFQVMKPKNSKQVDVNMKLIKFQSDTTPARPMYAPNPSPSSIQYRGIDYSEKTTIQTQKRILTTDDQGSILIQYQTVRPQIGNYRFEVTLGGDKVNKKQSFKARDFSVKSRDYPNVRTPRELAAPLVYLMSKKKYKKMMAIKNPDSLKEAIDTFWLSNIGNKDKAKKVLQLYYDRVEQANKQFSNYKAGWKTDPGMIYILYGPPWYVDQSLNYMQWTYGYNRYDPLRNFEFVENKIPSKYYPFNNYILQRHNYYFNAHYQKVQDWLSGYVLTHDL